MTVVAALTLYRWLRFLHVLAAMVWVGGGIMLAAVAAAGAAQRGDNAEARRQLTRWLWGYRVIILLLVVAVWDMTTKPGL